jgi:hypothetical protein
MKVRTFKELQVDMRDEQDIYPKRGSSLEEICISTLMDVVHHFDTIKSKISSDLFIRDKNNYESFKFFEKIMHQKFEIQMNLKERLCNIENYEHEFKEKRKMNEKYYNKR